MELGIGTVQFGVDYGISNKTGQVAVSTAKQILRYGMQHGVTVVDTAASYGDSEDIIGATLPAGHSLRLVTKLPRRSVEQPRTVDFDVLRNSVLASLKRLRLQALHGLLVHDAEDLLDEHGPILFDALRTLQREGLVSKVGVSAYTGDQIDQICERFDFDIVQVPVSVFDQRLVADGHLKCLKENGVEIHARSLFLQGLLLMQPDSLPRHFDSIRPLLGEFHAVVREMGATPLQAALSFVKSIQTIDVAVVGVTTLSEMKEVCAAWSTLEQLRLDLTRFAVNDNSIVNPTNWPRRA